MTSPTPLRRTPNLILGPFYPVSPPLDAGNELWSAGRAIRPGHRCVELRGHVIDLKGDAVCDALVEAWQADDLGRYRHPSAPCPQPDDVAFSGYAVQRTDSSGCYCFKTLVPGAYAADGARRAPHIHFQVTGAKDRLVTQMFFPCEPLNADDHWFGSVRRPEQLVAGVVLDTPDALHLRWDIVLTSG